MRRNRLHELLDAGQPTLGTHLHSSRPSVTELVGCAGHFDYAEIQTPRDARPYLDLGVKHFCVGTDMVTLWSRSGNTSRRRARRCAA